MWSSFHQTGAALLHQKQPDDFPHLIWANNYYRFAAFTMFTLFFGGATYAPDYAGGRAEYPGLLAAALHQRLRLGRAAAASTCLTCLVSASMNEPHYGLIGVPDLRSLAHLPFQRGVMPTPAQAIFLANGFAQDCADYGSPLPTFPVLNVGTERIDPQGASVWKDGCADIWRAQGVWDVDSAGNPRLLRPAHFARADFRQDFLKPFS